MPDGDLFAVHRVSGLIVVKAFRLDMKADLMAKEIEINPSVSLTALGAAKRITVKFSRLLFVLNRIGEVKNSRHASLYLGP